MNEPIRTQWQIRCAFNGFCKQVLKREAMNAHRDTKRQQLREITFSDLSPQEEKQLFIYDQYFADDEAEKYFVVGGCIFRKNRALAPHERSAVPLGTDHCPVG